MLQQAFLSIASIKQEQRTFMPLGAFLAARSLRLPAAGFVIAFDKINILISGDSSRLAARSFNSFDRIVSFHFQYSCQGKVIVHFFKISPVIIAEQKLLIEVGQKHPVVSHQNHIYPVVFHEDLEIIALTGSKFFP